MKPSSRLRGLHAKGVSQLERYEALASEDGKTEARSPGVSGWSVGQHLDHMATVDRRILEGLDRALEGPEPDHAGGPSLIGRIVLFVGRIPRGRGKAPAATAPRDLAAEEIAADLARQRAALADLEPRLAEIEACRGTFPHPVFGQLAPRQWLRFIDIHHRHHERIIHEVLASVGDRA